MKDPRTRNQLPEMARTNIKEQCGTEKSRNQREAEKERTRKERIKQNPLNISQKRREKPTPGEKERGIMGRGGKRGGNSKGSAIEVSVKLSSVLRGGRPIKHRRQKKGPSSTQAWGIDSRQQTAKETREDEKIGRNVRESGKVKP